MEDANKWCKDTLHQIVSDTKKAVNIVFSKDLAVNLWDSAMKNIDAGAGVGFGMGGELNIGRCGVELMARADMFSLQYTNGNLREISSRRTVSVRRVFLSTSVPEEHGVFGLTCPAGDDIIIKTEKSG